MTGLNKINFYQFDNLVANRVPFLFLNLSGESLSGWYTSIGKMHVDNHQIMAGEAEVMGILQERGLPRDYAIVLLCRDGETSLKIQAGLEKSGYTNVYVVNGGYRQMVTERA